MAYVNLDVYVHRSGSPVGGGKIRVLDRKGNPYSSENIPANGSVTARVPENEMYTIVIEPYRTGNKKQMAPHRHRESISFDLDQYGAR